MGTVTATNVATEAQLLANGPAFYAPTARQGDEFRCEDTGAIYVLTWAGTTPFFIFMGTGGGGRPVAVIRFAIGATGTYNSATLVPAGARVLLCTVEVTTAYPSGATITVGQAGALTLLQADNDNTPADPLLGATPNLYAKPLDAAWGAAALAVRATVAGAASGAGFVVVQYAIPAA